MINYYIHYVKLRGAPNKIRTRHPPPKWNTGIGPTITGSYNHRKLGGGQIAPRASRFVLAGPVVLMNYRGPACCCHSVRVSCCCHSVRSRAAAIPSQSLAAVILSQFRVSQGIIQTYKCNTCKFNATTSDININKYLFTRFTLLYMPYEHAPTALIFYWSN